MADWPYYTKLWARLRAEHLEREPFCCACRAQGLSTRANTVDHIIPIKAGGPAFPTHSGLASYCHRCHSAKTARGVEAGAIRSTKPRRGCDAAGQPLDPSHPWNRRKSLGAGAQGPTQGMRNQLVDRGDD